MPYMNDTIFTSAVDLTISQNMGKQGKMSE